MSYVDTIPVLQSAGKDIGRFYTGLDETPDFLFFTTKMSESLVFAGTFNAKTATVESSTKAGKKLGFFEGKRLPPCFPVNHGYYVVVSQGAFYASVPDYFISTPNGWQKCELADVVKTTKIN